MQCASTFFLSFEHLLTKRCQMKYRYYVLAMYLSLKLTYYNIITVLMISGIVEKKTIFFQKALRGRTRDKDYFVFY